MMIGDGYKQSDTGWWLYRGGPVPRGKLDRTQVYSGPSRLELDWVGSIIRNIDEQYSDVQLG